MHRLFAWFFIAGSAVLAAVAAVEVRVEDVAAQTGSMAQIRIVLSAPWRRGDSR